MACCKAYPHNFIGGTEENNETLGAKILGRSL